MKDSSSRRDFLKAFGSMAVMSAIGSRASAFPISRTLGPGSPAYIQEYWRRMNQWYARVFFDLNAAMTPAERNYVARCVTSLARWDLPLDDTQAFDRLQISHWVDGQKIRHGRLAVAPQEFAATEIDLARRIFVERGIPRVDLSSLYGLGWDFETGEFKTYSLHQGLDHLPEDLKGLAKDVTSQDLFPIVMSSRTYKSGKLQDAKVILPYRTPPSRSLESIAFGGAVLSTMEIRRLSGARQWHYRLKSFTLDLVAPAAHSTTLVHKREFGHLVDSILWTDRNRQTIYYP